MSESLAAFEADRSKLLTDPSPFLWPVGTLRGVALQTRAQGGGQGERVAALLLSRNASKRKSRKPCR